MGIFFRRSRVANSKVQGLIWLNFEPIQDCMVVLVNCKNEEDPIKVTVLEWSQHYQSIFKMLKGSDEILTKFNLFKLLSCPSYL